MHGSPILLKAGALSMIYDAGMLRYIRLGSEEMVRGIYAAVRDQNWSTLPADLVEIETDIQPDSFRIVFTSDHGVFAWTGTITGVADGTVTFTFDGEAKTTFTRNRIGFCVLHPMEVAGKRCEVEHVDGSVEDGAFPAVIAPHQPYFDIHALTHEALPGVRVEVRMEGDTFEMEDQRNWIDASYKTYCTPLALPFPVTVQAGTRIQQQVTVRLIGGAADLRVTEPAPTLTLEPVSVPLPEIGLCMASHGEPLTPQQRERLQALNLAHLRVEIAPGANITETLSAAMEVGLPLEVVVYEDFEEIAAVVEALKPTVARWLVYDYRQHATRPETVEAARRALARFGTPDHGAPIGSGTDAYFTELNRNRPTITLDWLSYSINPQVHAFDDASLIETLSAMGETVRSAKAFGGGARVAVTPITLKIRWNPNSTTAEALTPEQQIARQADPRQHSLFGAVWTLGSIGSLAAAGAESLTYYETTGALGVMDGNTVYPMYHVFAAVGAFAGGRLTPLRATHPLQYGGFQLEKDGRVCLLLANNTPEPQTVAVHGVTGGVNGRFTQKSLDDTTLERAAHDPDSFRTEHENPTADLSSIMLLPYAVVFLDQE